MCIIPGPEKPCSSKPLSTFKTASQQDCQMIRKTAPLPGKVNLVLSSILTFIAVNGCIQQTGAATHPPCKDSDSRATPLWVHCGKTPTAAFDHHGRLWVVYLINENEDKHVYLASSNDKGNTYNDPVKVTVAPEKIYENGENRPKLVFGPEGNFYISWTQILPSPFAGDIRFTRSTNGGITFDAPRTINDDGLVTSHRFDSLLVDSHGTVYLTWIDKRDLVYAENKGDSYEGAAIYYTYSVDQGESFSKNKKLADYSCQCCRIALSESEDGAAVFWRHIYENNTRDHAWAEINPQKINASHSVTRATYDDWQIEACPHHGPAMTEATSSKVGERIHHLVWFNGGGDYPGVRYGQYIPEKRRTEWVRTLTDSPRSSHADIEIANDRLWVVWKIFDGIKTRINMATSKNRGKDWQKYPGVADTGSASDHPFLVKDRNSLYLVWHTEAEGLRTIPLEQFAKAAEDD